MEQKTREKKQKVKVGEMGEKKNRAEETKKQWGGREASGKIAQEWYENDGKQSNLLCKTHQTLVTYTVK